VARLELYGANHCPYTREMREWLEWQRRDFIEYDLDSDLAARRRLAKLAGRHRQVPILVEDNKVIRVGWQGRTCLVETE
jgi:glutaredoxin